MRYLIKKKRTIIHRDGTMYVSPVPTGETTVFGQRIVEMKEAYQVGDSKDIYESESTVELSDTDLKQIISMLTQLGLSYYDNKYVGVSAPEPGAPDVIFEVEIQEIK